MLTNSTDWMDAWFTLFGTSPAGPLHQRDEASIKRVFRERVRRTHPDLTGEPTAREFQRVTEAYDLLMSRLRAKTGSATRRPPLPDGPARTVPPASRQTMPNRPLALAQFLFHLGWVPCDAVMAAVRWQQEEREPLGCIAVECGALSKGDVRRVLNHQRAGERFGACATRLGLLRADALLQLLERQRRLQPLVGQYFVHKGLLSTERIREAVERQRDHNQRVNRHRIRAA